MDGRLCHITNHKVRMLTNFSSNKYYYIASFLSTIPSQLSCYLLKLVYSIISAYSVATPNGQHPNDSISSTITIASTTDVTENHDVFGDLFRNNSIVETEIEADNAAKVRNTLLHCCSLNTNKQKIDKKEIYFHIAM